MLKYVITSILREVEWMMRDRCEGAERGERGWKGDRGESAIEREQFLCFAPSLV